MKTKYLFIVFFITILCCVSCSGAKKDAEVAKQADTDYQMAVNFYDAGHTPEAIRHLALVLASQPDHADANHLMGFIKMGRGQYEEAVRYFKAALKTNPDMLTCRNNLGAAYLHLEMYEEAAVIFKELTQSPLYTSPWLAFVKLNLLFVHIYLL